MLKQYLSGNPIFITINTTQEATLIVNTPDGNSISLIKNPENGVVKWNIQDIFEPLVPNRPFDKDEPMIFQRRGNNPWSDWEKPGVTWIGTPNIEILDSNGVTITTYDFVVYAGGIKTNLLRKLALNGKNIFDHKLNNYKKNFFMTTRTVNNYINMPLTEIDFLYYIHSYDRNAPTHPPVMFDIKDFNNNIITSSPINVINYSTIAYNISMYINTPGIYSISVCEDGTVLNFVEVLIIEVIEPIKSHERYILRFKNSYGMYERIEITGNAVSEQDIEEQENYLKHDAVTDSFIEQKTRSTATDIIKAECGYRTQDRLMFIRDMLQSDDVLLLNNENDWIKVFVTAENNIIPLRVTKPGSMAFTIRMAESDKFYSPDII